MGKGFLKLKSDQKRLSLMILAVGAFLTLVLGIRAYQDTKLDNGYELPKNEAPKGEYDQKVTAYVGEEKVSLDVVVQERKLSEAEVQMKFSEAEQLLPELLKGENESLSMICTELAFVEEIPGSPIEVIWTEVPENYLEVSETTTLKVSAVLAYEEYTKDYEAVITVLPKQPDIRGQILRMIEQTQEQKPEEKTLMLPQEYDGKRIVWKKPLELTFLYFVALTIGAVVLLKFGEKRDQKEAQKRRLEELEKDYAQIVSKFTMLLSAGLSVRNAWERIVLMSGKKECKERAVYQELNWGIHEMQKGVSELEVYEAVGVRTGQIHYKKLMALFISDKRRGSIRLLDAMNQEMLQAWEEQKRKTKQQGEKIGTKLLLPMMGMLGVVFMIILVPAFLSF